MKLEIIYCLVAVSAAVAMVYGWIANLINVMNIEVFACSGEMILQIIGIFIPFIGSVMGFVV